VISAGMINEYGILTAHEGIPREGPQEQAVGCNRLAKAHQAWVCARKPHEGEARWSSQYSGEFLEVEQPSLVEEEEEELVGLSMISEGWWSLV